MYVCSYANSCEHGLMYICTYASSGEHGLMYQMRESVCFTTLSSVLLQNHWLFCFPIVFQVCLLKLASLLKILLETSKTKLAVDLLEASFSLLHDHFLFLSALPFHLVIDIAAFDIIKTK